MPPRGPKKKKRRQMGDRWNSAPLKRRKLFRKKKMFSEDVESLTGPHTLYILNDEDGAKTGLSHPRQQAGEKEHPRLRHRHCVADPDHRPPSAEDPVTLRQRPGVRRHRLFDASEQHLKFALLGFRFPPPQQLSFLYSMRRSSISSSSCGLSPYQAKKHRKWKTAFW